MSILAQISEAIASSEVRLLVEVIGAGAMSWILRKLVQIESRLTRLETWLRLRDRPRPEDGEDA